MLKYVIPRADGAEDVVEVPREVEAKGPEALGQFYFAQCELRKAEEA